VEEDIGAIIVEVEEDPGIGVRGDAMLVDQLVTKVAVNGDSCCNGDDGDLL
jgi:hypothetical protein